MKQAITSTAEQVYADCSKPEQDALRDIFLRLTRLDDGDEGRDTRRRVLLDDLIPSGRDAASSTLLLDKLANARLVVKTVNEEVTEVEVAHEALIRHWERLRIWLNEDREGLLLHHHLSDTAHQWEKLGRESSELYRGTRLKQSEKWMREHHENLSDLEKEFIEASQNVKKRERMGGFAIAGMGVMLLTVIILALTGQLNFLINRPVDMGTYWVAIPAGEFQMGSENGEDDEKPVHTVYLDEFQIGKYEVTNRQYYQCLKAGTCSPPVNKTYIAPDYELHPVTDVSWNDANDYCEWVGGRLPTEAKWEKAASWDVETQTKFVYPWGNNDPTPELLNYNSNIGGARPVGKYPAGENGLYDMAGNVWEWVNDWYQSDYYAALGNNASNPQGPSSGNGIKVLRGGSWDFSDGNFVRSSDRVGFGLSITSSSFGFRCARDVP